MDLRAADKAYDRQAAEGNRFIDLFVVAWSLIPGHFLWIRTFKKIHDIGKPVERRGRKAMGLKAQLSAYDRQAAENRIPIFIEETKMPTRFDKKGKYFTEKVTKDKIKVIIHTLVDKLSGYLHVHSDKRLKDELNDSSGFLALTDGKVLNTQDEELDRFDFLAINREHIVWVIQVEDRELRQTPGGKL